MKQEVNRCVQKCLHRHINSLINFFRASKPYSLDLQRGEEDVFISSSLVIMSSPFEDYSWLFGQVLLFHFLVRVFLTGVYHKTFSKLLLPREFDVTSKLSF